VKPLETLSTLAAVLSAIWAWSSARSAAKSYRLAITQDSARTPHIDIYLAETEQRGADTDATVTYRFFLRVANTSETPNAIASIVLEIDYARGDVSGLQLVLQHQPMNDEVSFLLPKFLQPKEVVEGWVTFTLPREMRPGVRRESYQVAVIDTTSNRFSVRPIIIPERQL
jgi:hypothetical protein